MAGRNIDEYQIVQGIHLFQLESGIQEALEEGWNFLNKYGIQKQEHPSTYYVEMVKYEPTQAERRQMEREEEILTAEDVGDVIADRLRQGAGVGVDYTTMDPEDIRTVEERITELMRRDTTRRSARMNEEIATQIHQADIGTDENGRVFRGDRGWVDEDEVIPTQIHHEIREFRDGAWVDESDDDVESEEETDNNRLRRLGIDNETS